ncbi:MAG: tetratricopeptide repeat protein [Myxococcales bacterium]|nr:tetratricopeptide repeat protein [Myxococcales bacterium]
MSSREKAQKPASGASRTTAPKGRGVANSGRGREKRESVRPGAATSPRAAKKPVKKTRASARTKTAKKRTGAKQERVRLPLIEETDRPSARPPTPVRRRASGGEVPFRYRFASLLRLSDNLVRKAVAAYDHIFHLDNDDQGEIYLEMGLELLRDGKYPEAMQALRKAAAMRPRDATPLVELGAIHVRRKAPEAAVQVLDRAKELSDSDYRIHKLLADALCQLGKHDEAVAELEDALRLRPDVGEISYTLGLTLGRLERHDEAVDAFEIAIEAEPDNVLYYQSMGFALESAERRDEAVRCFKRALELEHRGIDAAE